MMWSPVGALRVGALLLLTSAELGAQVSSVAAALQRHGVQFDSSELAAVERGEVVVRTLPTREMRDVAVLGIVRVTVARHVYLRRVQDFRTWLRSPTRVRLGIFGDPAAPGDVAELQVSRQDVNELRKCRPGSCSSKLPAVEMQRARDQVDWRADDRQERVTALTRQRLLQFVAEYRAGGNASLPTYDDRAPVTAGDAFLAVLAQSTYLNHSAPAIAHYRRSYPRERPAGVADVIFWSEDVAPRLRPILSLMHAVVYTPPDVSGTTVVISRQLYANHYFEAAMELRHVIDREVAEEAASAFLVSERRYRFDNLPRGGILNIRGRAINGLRDQLMADLRRERATTELPVR